MSTTMIPRRQARLAVIEWMRGFNKRATNRVTMQFAGQHIYAVIHHQGRKSGTPYQTPVVARPEGNNFIFPLPYGQHVDWCRNILAAGTCRMTLNNREYHLRSPQLIKPEEALNAFPDWMHPLLRQTEIYLKMERASGPDLPPEQTIRKILVFGAGVLGSLYAGKLAQAGYDVTLLARGKRLEELRERGLVLLPDGGTELEHISIGVTDHLDPEDAYDLVLVIVRKNQLAEVLPVLAANKHTPNVLFLVNNAEGPEPLVKALGRERVLLGFPGAGGARSEGVVKYKVTAIQATTIGELSGIPTERLEQIAQALRDGGFNVAKSNHMDAWLKTHVAIVSPVANAIYLAGGSNYRLAHTRDALVLMLRAVKEGLRVVNKLKLPITPAKYKALLWLPEPLLLPLLRVGFDTPQAELVLARHANAARDEMLTLAQEFRTLARRSGVSTPAMDELYCALDPAYPVMPEGQAKLKLAWGSTAMVAGALVSLGILLGWLTFKRKRK